LAAFLLAAQVAQQCLVTPEKSLLNFSTESTVFGQVCRTNLGSKALSPSPKDEMSHDVNDQQYNGTPKQQADNGPTFAFLVRFFH